MPETKLIQYLKYEFSDSEIADRAKILAAATRKRAELEQRKKEIDSDLKGQIEAQNSIVGRVSDLIAAGFEYRDVECRVDFDSPEVNMKTVVRLDTGEEVKVLPMTDEDKQDSLDFPTEGTSA